MLNPSAAPSVGKSPTPNEQERNGLLKGDKEMSYSIMMSNYGFKIKSKADAQAFFDMKKGGAVSASDGEFYWNTTTTDYYLAVKGDKRSVFSRPMFERGNIFAPYVQVLDPVETIWKTRKWINAKWFTKNY